MLKAKASRADRALGDPRLTKLFETFRPYVVTAPGETVLEALVSTLKAMSPELINQGAAPGEKRWTADEINARLSGHYGIQPDTLRTALPKVQEAILADAVLDRVEARAEARETPNPAAKALGTVDDPSASAAAEKVGKNRKSVDEDLRAAFAEAKAKAKPDKYGTYDADYSHTRADVKSSIDELRRGATAQSEPERPSGNARDDVRAALNELKSNPSQQED